MVSDKIIEEVKRRLIKTYNPIEIYIFGSHARGTACPDSDLDLAIIVEELSKDRHQLLMDGYRALYGMRIYKDLLLYTKEEFEKHSKDATALSFEIKKEGKKIYAKA